MTSLRSESFFLYNNLPNFTMIKYNTFISMIWSTTNVVPTSPSIYFIKENSENIKITFILNDQTKI